MERMLFPKSSGILLQFLEQVGALCFHSRNLNGHDMRMQSMQRCFVGCIGGGSTKSLLVALILLLIGGDIALILLHQSNPLLECLQLCVSLVLQRAINSWRRISACSCGRGALGRCPATGAE